MHAARPSVVSFAIVLVSLAVASHAAGADVWTVPGPGTPTLQAAVDVAQDGDIVLVAAGLPDARALVDGKGLTFVADGAVTITDLEVRNLPSRAVFVLDGFTLDTPGGVPGAHTPLRAHDNLGELRVQHCTLFGDGGFAGIWKQGLDAYDGEPAARIATSSATFHHCTLVGGSGATLYDEAWDSFPTAGASALSVDHATVALFDCTLTGGQGGSVEDTRPYPGRVGGSGVEASSATVEVHGCTLTGGDGGHADCDYLACGDGGDGGHGVVLDGSGTTAATRDIACDPGLGGAAGGYPALDGVDGQDLLLAPGTTHIAYPAPYRGFDATTPAREGGLVTLAFTGLVGDSVLLFLAPDAAHLPKPAKQGLVLVGTILARSDVGTLGAEGALGLDLPVPELGPGIDGLDVHLQAATIAGGQGLLGPALVVTLLDASF